MAWTDEDAKAYAEATEGAGSANFEREDPNAVSCYCPFCNGPIFNRDFDGSALVQNPVYKSGELSYIELAHRPCQPEWAKNDDWRPAQ